MARGYGGGTGVGTGGGVIIRKTTARRGSNTRLGKAVGVASIGSPSSSTGKHSLPKRTTVVARKQAS
jgi:hypothetical protein